MPAKTIVITGAANGIGRFLSQHLINLNNTVLALDLHQERLASISNSPLLKTAVCDVSQEDQVKAALSQLSEIDVVINNAAIANPYSSVSKFEDTSLESWTTSLNVNLTGAFLVCKYAMPLLRKSQNKGRVINISSTRALQSEPLSEAYATTKAGMLGFTHALAVSVGGDVLVNCILPGWIDVRHLQANSNPLAPLSKEDHAQHPAGRVGTPEDITAMVDFLISEPGFITGQQFVVDGGMTKKMIYQE